TATGTGFDTADIAGGDHRPIMETGRRRIARAPCPALPPRGPRQRHTRRAQEERSTLFAAKSRELPFCATRLLCEPWVYPCDPGAPASTISQNCRSNAVTCRSQPDRRRTASRRAQAVEQRRGGKAVRHQPAHHLEIHDGGAGLGTELAIRLSPDVETPTHQQLLQFV